MAYSEFLSKPLTQTTQTRQQIRQLLRATRQNINHLKQEQASKKLCKKIKKILDSHFRWQKKINVATYLAADGEINLYKLFKPKIQRTGNPRFKAYYPIIQRNKTLKFGQSTKGKCPRKNRFGMREPLLANAQSIQTLDVVLLPLVAATPYCDRLGMGGGFYDRTLATLKRFKPKPLLIGVGHDIQIVDVLPVASWDYPLDYVVTDQRIFKRC